MKEEIENTKNLLLAIKHIVQNKQCSLVFIQEKMNMGVNSASNLLDELELIGVIGPFVGDKQREVLLKCYCDLKEC